MSPRRITYDGLAQGIALEVNALIRYSNNLSDGDVNNATIIEQMVMDRASEQSPSYLDHYDVASKALEMINYDAVVS